MLFFFLFRVPVFAAGEFNISQNIEYTVSPLGKTNVHQQVNLTNNFSQIYAKEYQINLSGSNISNVTGSDASGNIIDKVDTQADSTNIYLKFSQPVVGKDQTNHFDLDYSVSDFAKKKGNTWEIQFPQFTNDDNQQINLSLSVPSSLGDLSFSSVPVTDIHTLDNTTEIKFTQNQIKDNKILLVFGNHQLFDFKLSYFLQNDKGEDVNTEIALPPDTDTQNVIFKSIVPAPTSIKSDIDGNWLAQYFIPQGKSLDITVSGQAKIHPPVPFAQNSPDPSDIQPQKYWPTTDPAITSASQNLSTPKSIYKYVVNSLNYDYSGIDSAVRKGALSAIEFPNLSLCTEFTDLFVTLSRSKSIPAREIEGFAYSNDSKVKPINTLSDVLHAWPQYYDSITKRWVQVDPTWEKTTNGIDYFTDLDLNHLVFVIHGQSSEYPPPPGSYQKDKVTKSVFVDFATDELHPDLVSPELTVSRQRQILIKNSNLFSLHHIHLTLANSSLSVDLADLPPLGSTTLTLPTQSFLQSILPQSEKYHFSFSSQESIAPFNYSIVNQDHYLHLSICIGVIIFLLCLGGILLTVTRKKS